MKNITIRLQSGLIDRLDEEADEHGVSRSEYVRQIIRERHDAEELSEKVDSLQDRLDSREERISELEEQLARRPQVEQKGDELAMEVRDESEPPFFVKRYRWWLSRQ